MNSSVLIPIMCLTAAMIISLILWIESPLLSLSFGGWASAQQYNWQEERTRWTPHTLSSRLAAAELQLITEHVGPAIRIPEKRHVSFLLGEKRQETEYTSACTRILAKGTHNQGKHISTCRGNTYHRNSSGGTDISGGVAGDMCSGEQKIRGNTYLRYSGFRKENRRGQY